MTISPLDPRIQALQDARDKRVQDAADQKELPIDERIVIELENLSYIQTRRGFFVAAERFDVIIKAINNRPWSKLLKKREVKLVLDQYEVAKKQAARGEVAARGTFEVMIKELANHISAHLSAIN